MRVYYWISVMTFTASLLASSAFGDVLEIPGNGQTISGISIISGWKCAANGPITVTFDNNGPTTLVYGSSRQDTSTVCHDDGNNGFIAQFDYGLLGSGTHVAHVFDNGVEFGTASFNVVAFDQPFVRGLSGTFQLAGFPGSNEGVTLEWQEGLQSFVVTSRCGSPGNPCPDNGCNKRPDGICGDGKVDPGEACDLPNGTVLGPCQTPGYELLCVSCDFYCQPGNTCGGFAGTKCPTNELCILPDGQCRGADLIGTCIPSTLRCPEVELPVCGCDGQTYSNSCQAHARGISVDHDGPCSVCGNGILESGEECDLPVDPCVPLGINPQHCDSTTCQCVGLFG